MMITPSQDTPVVAVVESRSQIVQILCVAITVSLLTSPSKSTAAPIRTWGKTIWTPASAQRCQRCFFTQPPFTPTNNGTGCTSYPTPATATGDGDVFTVLVGRRNVAGAVAQQQPQPADCGQLVAAGQPPHDRRKSALPAGAGGGRGQRHLIPSAVRGAGQHAAPVDRHRGAAPAAARVRMQIICALMLSYWGWVFRLVSFRKIEYNSIIIIIGRHYNRDWTWPPRNSFKMRSCRTTWIIFVQILLANK